MGNVFCPPGGEDDDRHHGGAASALSSSHHHHHPPPTSPAADPTTTLLVRRDSSPLPHLHQSITLRERRGADPYEHYEALAVIGFGSMGSVTRVRKRPEKEGGSARARNVDPCAGCLNHPTWGRCARRFVRAKRAACEAVEPLVGETCRDGGKRGKSGGGGLASGGLASVWPGTAAAAAAGGKSDAGASAAAGGANHSSGRAGKKRTKRVLFEALSSMTGASTRSGSGDGGGGMFGRRRRGGGGNTTSYEAAHLALKSIHLARVRHQAEEFLDELRNEVAILRSLDHPFVVRALETFEHRRQLYVVMELCTGGDLYARDPYGEEEAARISRMILSAVAYMHERNVVHRDLKYENIMFANHGPQSEIKIIDYGLSKKFGPDEQYFRDGVGTIYTMAPQVLEGKYTSACDLWSVGCITYALLSSQVPFYANKRRKLVEQIKKGKYDFKGRRWSVVSRQAKDFVADLLQVDPDVRPTADEARKSLWLNRSFADTVRLSDDMDDNVGSSIYNFSKYNQLQKLALMVVAHKSSSEEIGFLRKAFQQYDKGAAGVITRSEFRSCLVNYGYSNEELDRMFEAVDIDATGFIRYTEFLAATIEVHGAINEERLAEAFDRLDSDDSGYISADNLRSILGDEIPQADINRILQESAIENDKKISYDEFLSLWDVDQERQRENALRSVMARKAKESAASLSSFAPTSESSTPSDNRSGDDSSSRSQIGLSIDSTRYAGRSSAREPSNAGARPNLPTILSPSVQPTEAPAEPASLLI